MGCDRITLSDGRTGIVCGVRRKKTNERCFYCGNKAEFQCDHPVWRHNKRSTCDTWLCVSCRNHIGDDLDLCRNHFNVWRNNGERFSI